MRLWSLHPKYLDSKGLVALWREGLLAKNVLEGRTKGYKNHPQLTRFKGYPDPLKAIHAYLFEVWKEAFARGYNFDKNKIIEVELEQKLKVTIGQLRYEFQHLLAKLSVRAPEKYEEIKCEIRIEPNPVFIVIEGGVEEWEKVKRAYAVPLWP